MADRDFYKRQDILRTDYSGIERGLGNLFNHVAAQRLKRKQDVDHYKYALDYGNFPNDNAFNEQYVKNVIALGKSEIGKSGGVSQNTLGMEEQGRRIAADQKAQYDRFVKLNAEVDKRGTEDKYYDPAIDKSNLKKAAFGETNDVDFRTRNERLDAVSQAIGRDPRAFKFNDYLADYIKDRGVKEQGDKTGNDLTGYTQSYSYKTPFIDDKTGKPGVTDQHAVDFLKSNEDLMNHVQFKVDMDLLQNDVSAISQLASQNDDRAEWAKGLSKTEILDKLKMDPSKNPFDKTPYNQRVINQTKKSLTDASSITENTLVDYRKPEKLPADGMGVNNDNIGHGHTFYNNKISTEGVTDPVTGAFQTSSVAGPGGVLMIKKGTNPGRPVVLELDSKNAFNYNSGKNSERKGIGAFNMTGYQLLPYTKDGQLHTLSANSAEELKEKIKGLSPMALRNMAPELQIGLVGYTVDQSKILGDISTKSFELNEKLGDAVEAGDADQQKKLQTQIDQLGQLRKMFNLEGVSDEDIINAASKVGIRSTRADQILQASPSDLDKVKTVTEGLDLKNKKFWNKDMIDLNKVYGEAWNKAQETAEPAPAPATKKKATKPAAEPAKTELPTIDTEDAYKALAPGTEYVGPDGVKRKKK